MTAAQERAYWLRRRRWYLDEAASLAASDDGTAWTQHRIARMKREAFECEIRAGQAWFREVVR